MRVIQGNGAYSIDYRKVPTNGYSFPILKCYLCGLAVDCDVDNAARVAARTFRTAFIVVLGC
jgi:hypothetical protein